MCIVAPHCEHNFVNSASDAFGSFRQTDALKMYHNIRVPNDASEMRLPGVEITHDSYV